jgi:hypothetical protein
MRSLLSIVVVVWMVVVSSAQRFTVSIFLLEDCKISQAYTQTIKQLIARYEAQGITFDLYFPNPISSDSTIQEFTQKFGLPLQKVKPNANAFAKQHGLEVTPEVMVYDHQREEIVYKGRIDNMYERVGKRRRVITRHDLALALDQLLKQGNTNITSTRAVGCIIPYD